MCGLKCWMLTISKNLQDKLNALIYVTVNVATCARLIYADCMQALSLLNHAAVTVGRSVIMDDEYGNLKEVIDKEPRRKFKYSRYSP